jgi:hypothetical protein
MLRARWVTFHRAAHAETVVTVAVQPARVTDSWVREQLRRLPAGSSRWDVVLFGWGLEQGGESGEEGEKSEKSERLAEHRRALLALLLLLQATQREPGASCARLVVLTRAEPERPEQGATPPGVHGTLHASLGGLVRSARYEMPRDVRLQCVHLADEGLAAEAEAEARMVVRELVSGEGFGEEDVMLGTGGRRVARCVHLEDTAAGSEFLAPKGTIAVTGGTGALGLTLACFLVREPSHTQELTLELLARCTPANTCLGNQSQRTNRTLGSGRHPMSSCYVSLPRLAMISTPNSHRDLTPKRTPNAPGLLAIYAHEPNSPKPRPTLIRCVTGPCIISRRCNQGRGACCCCRARATWQRPTCLCGRS